MHAVGDARRVAADPYCIFGDVPVSLDRRQTHGEFLAMMTKWNMTVSESKSNFLIRNILVLVDFSACSQQAVLYGLMIAKRYGATITLLHVTSAHRSPIKPGETAKVPRDELKMLEADLGKRGLLPPVPHNVLVKQGNPWTVISEVLTKYKIDLIVTGTHGRTGLEMILMGSFAETIFRRAKCPVLTVGPKIRVGPPDVPPKNIVFATDFSEAAEAAEPYAFSLAATNGARLTLLNVVRRASSARLEQTRLSYAKGRLEATQLHTAAMKSGLRPNLMVESGVPAETILRVAERLKADRIVLGASAPRKLADRLGVTVAYRVVCAAPCPVLTIREPSPFDYFERLFAVMPKIKSSSGPIRGRGRSMPYARWA